MLEEMSALEYNQHTLSPERECPEKITSGSTNPAAPQISGGESHVSCVSLITYFPRATCDKVCHHTINWLLDGLMFSSLMFLSGVKLCFHVLYVMCLSHFLACFIVLYATNQNVTWLPFTFYLRSKMQIKCMWSRERVKFDIGADVNWQEGGDRFKQAVWPTFWVLWFYI